MNKKIYFEPQIEIVNVKPENIIATSGGTGATIPDAGWGDAKERYGDSDISEDEL